MLVSERFAIDLKDQKVKIHSCKVKINMIIRPRSSLIEKKVQEIIEIMIRPFLEV